MANPDKNNKNPRLKATMAAAVISTSLLVAFHPNISQVNMGKLDKALDILSKVWVLVELVE